MILKFSHPIAFFFMPMFMSMLQVCSCGVAWQESPRSRPPWTPTSSRRGEPFTTVWAAWAAAQSATSGTIRVAVLVSHVRAMERKSPKSIYNFASWVVSLRIAFLFVVLSASFHHDVLSIGSDQADRLALFIVLSLADWLCFIFYKNYKFWWLDVPDF